MEFCKQKDIIDFFNLINCHEVNYLLLRNLNNELPDKLPQNKDIDLLVHETDEIKFDQIMKQNGWKSKRHPLSHFPYLYGITPFKFYSKNGVNLDICYQLACRSLNKGEWFPLDMEIQSDIWQTKLKTTKLPWNFTLSVENEFIHLITRCVFDKKVFNNEYISRIEDLRTKANMEIIELKFQLIFFKFTKTLLENLAMKEYDQIIMNHLKFKDY